MNTHHSNTALRLKRGTERERAKEKINPANEANETRQHLRESHRQADGEMEL